VVGLTIARRPGNHLEPGILGSIRSIRSIVASSREVDRLIGCIVACPGSPEKYSPNYVQSVGDVVNCMDA